MSVRPKTEDSHHLYSSLREKIIEHVFVGESLRALWRRGVFDVEVLRSEFDAHGYDLVMSRGDIIRFIQFKTGVREKPRHVSIPVALESKTGGCVIWIQVDNNLDMKSFWWLGSDPGASMPPLGDHVAKRIGRISSGTRPLRKNHRIVNGSVFRKFDNLDDVLETLFGQLPKGGPPDLRPEDDKDEE